MKSKCPHCKKEVDYSLIPASRILISAFAGHCGIVRKIKPAEHTIVIDADPTVCEWWDSWRRGPKGRALEIHHCDSIEWLRHRFGLTEYSAPGSCGIAGWDAGSGGTTRSSPQNSEAKIVVETHYKGHQKVATTGEWQIKVWVQSGELIALKNIPPIGWVLDAKKEMPQQILSELVKSLVFDTPDSVVRGSRNGLRLPIADLSVDRTLAVDRPSRSDAWGPAGRTNLVELPGDR